MSTSQIIWGIILATSFLGLVLWGLTWLSNWCDRQMAERLKNSPFNKEKTDELP